VTPIRLSASFAWPHPSPLSFAAASVRINGAGQDYLVIIAFSIELLDWNQGSTYRLAYVS